MSQYYIIHCIIIIIIIIIIIGIIPFNVRYLKFQKLDKGSGNISFVFIS